MSDFDPSSIHKNNCVLPTERYPSNEGGVSKKQERHPRKERDIQETRETSKKKERHQRREVDIQEKREASKKRERGIQEKRETSKKQERHPKKQPHTNKRELEYERIAAVSKLIDISRVERRLLLLIFNFNRTTLVAINIPLRLLGHLD